MKNQSLFETEKDIEFTVITEETLGQVSSVGVFLKKWIISPIPKYKHIKKPVASRLLYVFGIILTLLLPLYMNFVMELIHSGSVRGVLDYVKFYHGSAIFSTLMLYGVFALLWLIFKKGFLSSFVFVLLCAALSVTNYFKHTLTGDFVYPWDLVNQTGNLKELTEFVKMGLPPKFLLSIIIGFMFPIGSFFLKSDIPLKALSRLPIAALILILAFFSFNTPEQIDKTLAKFNMTINSTAAQETNHIVNGFSGGFMVNCLTMNVAEPKDYSNEKIDNIMAKYPPRAATEGFSSPDIILILSESFWDVRQLPNTTFSENPLKNFDEICQRDNCYSGDMYQTAFGGGTVRTEFEVLTGLTTDPLPVGAVPWQYISKDTPTFASHYKNSGYRTVFMHTFGSAFYMRKQTYPYLGFDEIYFAEDLLEFEEIPYAVSGRYISDDSFASYLSLLLDKESEPCFLFGISMENHQPYENKYEEPLIKVSNPTLSESALLPLKSYTTGVAMADKALKKITDYIDQREKDTILIYFGDHLPTLGADKLTYKESGFISEGEMSADEWRAIMRTPFLIYSNFTLKESEMLKIGTGNALSSYNLLNAASDLIGAPTSSLMEFLKAYSGEIQYYNPRLKLIPTKSQQKFIDNHSLITYDRIIGKGYSE